MTEAGRYRLVALKKAKNNKMTQRQEAEELKVSGRQVLRLLAKLSQGGDKSVVHGLRGRSNRKMAVADQQRRSRF